MDRCAYFRFPNRKTPNNLCVNGMDFHFSEIQFRFASHISIRNRLKKLLTCFFLSYSDYNFSSVSHSIQCVEKATKKNK